MKFFFSRPLHTDFSHQPAPVIAQYAALLSLAMIALPLLWQLSATVMVVFVLFWLLRLGMLRLNAPPLNYLALVVLMLLAMVLVFAQIKSLWGRDGGIAFLLLMALLKSFESRHIRDWQVLLLSALFLTVGTLLFSQSISDATWTAGCLWAVLTCLHLLDGGRWRDAWRLAARGMAYSLPLAAVLFVAVPRLSEPLLQLVPTPSERAVSGLSDTLRAGTFSQMVLSDEPAFNAVFADSFVPKNSQLYWRTLILPDFDGHEWRQMKPEYMGNIAAAFPRHNAVRYELILKDWNGHIPALDYPTAADSHTLLFDTATVMTRRSYAQLRRITLSSVLSDRLPDRLHPQNRQRYLALPSALNPRTRALAQNLRRHAVNDEIFARRALAYFSEQRFVYTLNPPALTGFDHEVDEFMFTSKSGFCGHYASAFAVMMRAGGVPARVVTGYQGGEYNADAQFWQVRSRDAHAWTEVWLSEQQSWLRIDPTSAISVRADEGVNAALPAGENIGRSRLPAWMTRFAGESRFYWQKWVVDFDAERQNDLFQKMGFGRVDVTSVLLILLTGGTLALLPMLWWWRVNLRRQSHPLAEGFLLLKMRLTDKESAPSLGPQDLLTHLRATKQWDETIQRLVEDYIHLRYRQNTPSDRAVRTWFSRAKKYRPRKKDGS